MLQSVTSTVSLTQNSWTKLLEADESRKALEIMNLDSADSLSVAFIKNPWEISFDGTNDYMTLAAGALTALADDTAGAISACVELEAVTDTAKRTVWSICKAGSNTYLECYIDTAGRVVAQLVKAGVAQWVVRTIEKLDTNHNEVKIIHNGTEPKIHVNRGESTITQVTTTDLTPWISDISATVDKFYLGCVDVGAGAAEFFQGDIHWFKVASGVNSDHTRQELSALWEFTEGTGNVTDVIGSYAGTLSGATWASYEPGKTVLKESEWYSEFDLCPTAAVWAYTTGAAVSASVLSSTENFRLRM